jgi:hypothetical protein
MTMVCKGMGLRRAREKFARNHILMSHKTVCHTFIGPGARSMCCSVAMTMMCGGEGLMCRARRIIPAELRLGKSTLVPLYNAACRGQSCSAYQSVRHPREMWRRTGDGFQQWLLRFIHLFRVQNQDGNQP